MKNNSPKNKIRLFFTGLTMGLADLVPGVSSGTIAIVFGVYDELLYTIKLITGRVPKLILEGKFKQAFQLVPFAFVLPLGAGLLLAIFGFVRLVSFLLTNYPVLVWAFFFGLVLGSAYIVSKRVTKWTTRRGLLLLLGLALTFIIVGLPALTGSTAPLAVFVTGAIAVTAMILPGISGSLMMVLLGQYEVIINAVAERNFVLLIIFTAGALVGLALFVRLLTWLLKNYHLAVIAFLIGVMIGSLRQIWPWKVIDINGLATNVLPPIEASMLWAIMLAAIGFALVFILERVGIAREQDYINTPDFEHELSAGAEEN
jgi:putative membrane protein